MKRYSWGLLGLLLLAVFALSLLVGRYPQPYVMAPDRLMNDPLAQRLVLMLRLPRLFMACLLGMALAASGTVLQMIFRNPLVEPGFLGISQGAAFGAALSIVALGTQTMTLQLSATFFAFLGLSFSYFLAQRIRYGGWVLRLVLAGIAVSALFAAGVGLLKYLADPLTQLQDIVFWTLGGLSGSSWAKLSIVAPMTALALVILLLMRWRLNLLSLQDETAFSLGTQPERERLVLVVAAVVATAAVISVSGIVGWVGLIVPHLARRLLGADAQRALPASMIIGAIFVMVCDDLARSLLPGEIPLGILTSLIGALVFIALMVRRPAERLR